ncbi:hypothetical protein K504DRAFT_461718 [Pleomassaria siparia CBS 279.74]|uniref:Uncharacterized protein n=1 Tax=Pleomassaria siparia CBS 279.74 TaxID=1314801 RepID=A0A6G1KJQ5_9PLEO|nr:hypothetical protein K504DRAFT_461718 [Pleomassaria siparia CBS 279.74]
MTSGTRKTHTKSRNGCSQCKARRKKVRVSSDPHLPSPGSIDPEHSTGISLVDQDA